MFDFHFLFKISQLNIIGVLFPLLMPTTNEVAPLSQQATPPPPPPPQKRKNPSFEEQPSLTPTLKMLLHSRQLLKTVQAPKF